MLITPELSGLYRSLRTNTAYSGAWEDLIVDNWSGSNAWDCSSVNKLLMLKNYQWFPIVIILSSAGSGQLSNSHTDHNSGNSGWIQCGLPGTRWWSNVTQSSRLNNKNYAKPHINPPGSKIDRSQLVSRKALSLGRGNDVLAKLLAGFTAVFWDWAPH